MCEYCEGKEKVGGRNLHLTICGYRLSFHGMFLGVPLRKDFEIFYCPMCGRKLRWDENV